MRADPAGRLRLTPNHSGLDDQISVDNPGRRPQLPTRLVDTLLVADATGATAEFWLRRAPCEALVAGRSSGISPTAALLAAIDALLGPPPAR